MADQKITALTAVTSPADADLLPTVQDVATTPVTKKVTWTTVKAFLKTYFDTLYAPVDRYSLSSSYETTGRFSKYLVNTGAVTFGSDGIDMTTGGTSGSSANCNMPLGNVIRTFNKNGIATFGGMNLQSPTGTGTGEAYFGTGYCNPEGAGHTFTTHHAGFKIIYTTNDQVFSATNGNGTTETATTLTDFDTGTPTTFHVYATDGTSTKFYQGTTLVATHTTNLPSGIQNRIGDVSVSNKSTASTIRILSSFISWSGETL